MRQRKKKIQNLITVNKVNDSTNHYKNIKLNKRCKEKKITVSNKTM